MPRWIVLALIAAGCKKTPPADTSPQGSAGSDLKATQGSDSGSGSGAGSPPPAAWKIDSQPVQLMCGEQPLPLPSPTAAGTKPERPLTHAEPIKACQDQASVAAVCDCLARSIKDWGGGLELSPEVRCEPQAPASPDAQIVMVSSKPADESTSGGEAFLFVAKRGQAWSPVAVIEAAPDVDLSVTPKASHTAKLDRVESHGNLYWIESHNEAQEKEMGDSNRDGEAHGSVCAIGAAPWCGRLLLGAWTYAFTPATSECTITKVTTYSATLSEKSLTLRLDHGIDEAGATGSYSF